METRRNDVARIFNIQRYSLNDGEGIRTVVFFKGCPHLCPWCANPESISGKIQTVRREAKCLHCAKCLRDADECPSGAFERIGRDISLDALEREVMKDDIFFRTSGGGGCHAPLKLPETHQPASYYHWRNCAMKCCSI